MQDRRCYFSRRNTYCRPKIGTVLDFARGGRTRTLVDMDMKALAALLAGMSAASTAFVAPQAGVVGGAAPSGTSTQGHGRCWRAPFLTARTGTGSIERLTPVARGERLAPPLSMTASATQKEGTTQTDPHRFDGYEGPIVLIGSSSSPEADEIRRLALSLSGSLAGGNPDRQRERRPGVDLLGDDLDHRGGSNDENLAGIPLSAVGMNEEGPFVLDAGVIGESIRKGTLSLASGVISLDFNHPAFETDDAGLRSDLTRAMSDLARQLYEDLGLLIVYVNVRPDGMELTEEARAMEDEVMIPFSDYEMCLRNEGADGDAGSWEDAEWELNRIVARALLPSPVVGGAGNGSADLAMGINTFFVSLTFPEVEDAAPYVGDMCRDVDSMEYRVDLLDAARRYVDGDTTSRFDVLYQQQRLRAMCRPHSQRAPGLPYAGTTIIDDAVPIVYTVRTANQAGTWPDDDKGIKKMFNLLELGLRSAAEVLDVESAWDPALVDRLLILARSRYTSLILGSHHVVGEQVSMDEAVDLFLQCSMKGRAHGAKVVLSILSNDDGEDRLAYEASLRAARLQDPEIPNISLILGEVGSYSRILNPRFTPVTHECLPSVAAPGQLTASEIMAGRLIDGQLKVQRYGILGHNIAYSVSPQMQSAAFAAAKLPYTYTRCDVETVEEFVEGPIWNDDNFGGCSVTIPHKQNIISHLDVLTDAAREIGSVNTVIVKKDKKGTRVLIGDNTDWKGMYNPLRRLVGDIVAKGSKERGAIPYALILGGGGTARAAAYTAARLGLERVYWNRTPSKAASLAREFGGVVASNLDDDADDGGSLCSILTENKGTLKVVISTLPNAAGFTLPEWLLAGPTPLPAVLDVNYKPYDTLLLKQAVEKGCDVVRGSEMLWEQGVGQFELWTGRAAPYGVMRRVVLDNCLPEGGEEK